MSKENWSDTERVVHLIETALAADAKVEPARKLWNPSRNEESQFDCVITQSDAHGEIVTVVEVQDHTRKPEANDMRGWWLKAKEVGAARLIAVSRIGFTAPDKYWAANNPCISLITLEDLEPPDWPQNLGLTGMWVVETQFKLNGFCINGSFEGSPQPLIETEEAESRARRLVIESADGRKPRSVHDLFRILSGNISRPNVEIGTAQEFGYEMKDHSTKWHLNLHGRRLDVESISFVLNTEQRKFTLPLRISGYRQENVERTLAWVAEGRVTVPAGEIVSRIVFRLDHSERLRPAIVEVHTSFPSVLKLPEAVGEPVRIYRRIEESESVSEAKRKRKSRRQKPKYR